MITKTSGVFKITSRTTGKSYIGSSVNMQRRVYDLKDNARHKRGTKGPLHRAFHELGIDDFTFEVLEEAPEEKLDDLKQHYINKYDTKENGYNGAQYRGNSRQMPDELRKKIAAGKKRAWEYAKRKDLEHGRDFHKAARSVVLENLDTGEKKEFYSITAACRSFFNEKQRRLEAKGDPDAKVLLNRRVAMVYAYLHGRVKTLNIKGGNYDVYFKEGN